MIPFKLEYFSHMGVLQKSNVRHPITMPAMLSPTNLFPLSSSYMLHFQLKVMGIVITVDSFRYYRTLMPYIYLKG